VEKSASGAEELGAEFRAEVEEVKGGVFLTAHYGPCEWRVVTFVSSVDGQTNVEEESYHANLALGSGCVECGLVVVVLGVRVCAVGEQESKEASAAMTLEEKGCAALIIHGVDVEAFIDEGADQVGAAVPDCCMH
jgi:hypothetical protein